MIETLAIALWLETVIKIVVSVLAVCMLPALAWFILGGSGGGGVNPG